MVKLHDLAVQRVNLASSITKEFVVRAMLDDKLFDSSVDYWVKQMDLTPVSIDGLTSQKGGGDIVKTARAVLGGGSVWSRSFNKYRKIVSIHLCGLRSYTYANVRIDLPGAYRLSPEDIDQAIETIDSFCSHLSSARYTDEEGVVAKRAISK